MIYTPSEWSESPKLPDQSSQTGEGVRVVCAADDDDGVHVYARCEDGVYSDTSDSEEEIAVSRLMAFFTFFTSHHSDNISV